MFLYVFQCTKKLLRTSEKSWIIAREQSCDLSNRAHRHDSPSAGFRRCFVIGSKFPRALIIEMLAVTQRRIHYLKLYITYAHHRCYINCDIVNGMDFCSYGSAFFNRGTLTNIERNISWTNKNSQWSIGHGAILL